MKASSFLAIFFDLRKRLEDCPQCGYSAGLSSKLD